MRTIVIAAWISLSTIASAQQFPEFVDLDKAGVLDVPKPEAESWLSQFGSPE